MKKVLYGALAIGMLALVPPGEAANPAASPATNAPASLVAASSQDPSSSPVNPKEKSPDTLMIKILSLMLAITAIVLGITVAIFILWTDYRKRRDLIAFCHQERMAALEKGLDLPPFPPGILDGVHPKQGPDPSAPPKGLKAGLIWLTVGIGSAIYYQMTPGGDVPPLVPVISLAIGVAFLVFYVIERRQWKERRIAQ